MYAKAVPVALALAVAGGCATEENFRQALSTTVGLTEAQLVGRLGPPDNVYRSDVNSEASSKFITYKRANTGVLPGYVSCFGYTCYAIPPTAYTNACSVTFRLDGGRVASWRYEGNACRM